jgi:hypothetical protein
MLEQIPNNQSDSAKPLKAMATIYIPVVKIVSLFRKEFGEPIVFRVEIF